MLSFDIKNALLTTRLCQYLDPQELDMLILHNKIVHFKPDEIILKQGKKNDALYIIISGTTAVTAKILGEGVTHLATLDRGNFIGEVSLIDKGPCATTVRTITEVSCLMISSLYFEMLSIFFTETKFKLLRAITREVYYRIQDEYHKIIKYINESNMTSGSLFGEVARPLERPGPISFEEAGIGLNELKKSDFFSVFSPDEFKKILKYSTLMTSPKNNNLIKDGERFATCYIVIRGAVQSSILSGTRGAKISVVGPHNLFCSTTCIDGSFPSIINYRTCDAAILMKFTEENLITLQKFNVKLWYKMYEIIARSVVGLERAADKLDVRLNSELYNR